jgi:hypothetical protein
LDTGGIGLLGLFHRALGVVISIFVDVVSGVANNEIERALLWNEALVVFFVL